MKLDMKKMKLHALEECCSLGPDLDVQVAMSMGRNSKRRCTIFSPDWIVNKTGMSLQYKLSGRPGTVNSLSKGDMPIMVRSGKGRNVMCIPVSEPQKDNLDRYWDSDERGEIKFVKGLRFLPSTKHMKVGPKHQHQKEKENQHQERDEHKKEVIVDWR